MNMDTLSRKVPNPNLGLLEEVVIEIKSLLRKMLLSYISDEGHFWIIIHLKKGKKKATHITHKLSPINNPHKM